MMLITLEAAKADLLIDHDLDDEDLESKIKQSSAVVMNYLGIAQTYYEDSLGNIPTDDNGEPDVPFEVRAATLLMTRMLYKGEGDLMQWQAGYPPTPVMSLLYPLRMPSVG